MNKTKVTVIISLFVILALIATVCLTVFYLASNNLLPNNSSNSNQTTTEINEFKSVKNVIIKLDNFKSGKTISSPLTITGQVPGNLSYEAIFPVTIVDSDGAVIAESSAVLTGNWMTEDYVPFTVTLNFESPTTNKTGTLILHKDNASGLPENDDTIEIPIKFE